MKKEIEINITLVQKDKYNWQEAEKVGDSEIKYHASDADRRKELEDKTFKSDLLFSLAMGSSTRMAEYIKAMYTSYWRDDEGNITDNSAMRYEVNLRY